MVAARNGDGYVQLGPRSRPFVTRNPSPGPRGVMEVDWPFFGEICRALALKVARVYEPEVVLGIAKAGVIPGAVVASILDLRYFATKCT